MEYGNTTICVRQGLTIYVYKHIQWSFVGWENLVKVMIMK